jgi:hypothetical protein
MKAFIKEAGKIYIYEVAKKEERDEYFDDLIIDTLEFITRALILPNEL